MFYSAHRIHLEPQNERRNSIDNDPGTREETVLALPSSHASLSFNLVSFLRSHTIARRP